MLLKTSVCDFLLAKITCRYLPGKPYLSQHRLRSSMSSSHRPQEPVVKPKASKTGVAEGSFLGQSDVKRGREDNCGLLTVLHQVHASPKAMLASIHDTSKKLGAGSEQNKQRRIKPIPWQLASTNTPLTQSMYLMQQYVPQLAISPQALQIQAFG